MATLAKLVVKLITDVSEFEAGMAAASKKLTKIGDEMSKVGDKLTKGVTLPIVAVSAAAVKFASDLNENLNKANVVFGKSAEEIVKWSKTASTSFGMSQSAALDSAGKFGSLFVTMGLGTDKASEMSMTLTQLAADLGSFYNISAADAMEKLRSGLVGEAEPLRSVGVLINETAVKAKAMEMGLGSATGALTEQEKVLARYAIILDQTKIAQGDFNNTQYSFANLMKTIEALGADVLASFGKQLIPALISFMKALIPTLEWFNKLPDSAKSAIVNILLLSAAFGPVLSIVGRVISAFGSFAGLFKAGGALAKVGPLVAKLGPVFAKGFTALPGLFAGLGTTIGGAGTAVGGFVAALGSIAAVVLPIGIAIAALVVTWKMFGKEATESAVMLGKIVTAELMKLWWSITGFFDRLGKTDWSGVWENIKGGFVQFGANVGTWLQGAGQSLSQFLQNAMSFDMGQFGPKALVSLQQLGAIIGVGLSNLTGTISQWIGQVVNLDWGAIARAGWQAFLNFGKAVGNALKSATGWINQFLQNAIAGITGFGTQLAAGIGKTLANLAVIVNNAIKSAWNSIYRWFNNFFSAGQYLMAGFVNGIASFAVRVVESVMRVVQWVIDAINNMLGIASPSTVTEGIAKNMMLGMEQGFKRFSAGPIKASLEATGQMAPAAAASVGGGGGRTVQINIPGPFIFYGDLSESQQESLERRIREIFDTELVAVLEGA